MAGPFSTFTERLYGRLPEHYRDADAVQTGDQPLRRYLSLMGDQAGEVEELVDRIDFVPEHEGGIAGDTSDLVDHAEAEEAWLPWLGQLVGAQIDPGLTEAEKRDAIEFAPAGWRAGNKAAIADAARTALTGTKYAQVYDHMEDVGVPGGEWDVLVVTKPAETPDPALVLVAIVAKNAKPAGVVLHHGEYSADWGDVEAAAPTWADWEALGSWAGIETAGI